MFVGRTLRKLKQPHFGTTIVLLRFTPWKESHDQPRQHIQKQRHYFADKGPSS